MNKTKTKTEIKTTLVNSVACEGKKLVCFIICYIFETINHE